jgi:hypothetical protein
LLRGTTPTGQFKGLDFKALGIPTEQEFHDLYCRYSGRDRIDPHFFFVAFSFFRSAAIVQGVYKRGLGGNASSQKALKLGHSARVRAETAWRIVEQSFWCTSEISGRHLSINGHRRRALWHPRPIPIAIFATRSALHSQSFQLVHNPHNIYTPVNTSQQQFRASDGPDRNRNAFELMQV